MPTGEKIQLQVKKVPGHEKLLQAYPKEFTHLAVLLEDEEYIIDIIGCGMGDTWGIMLATNQRVLFVAKWLLKLTVENYAYEEISSIQYQTGLVMADIVITLPSRLLKKSG